MSYSVHSIREIAMGIFDGPHATPELHDDGAAVFLGITNLTESGTISLSDARFVSETDYPRWTKRVIPQGDDIVFTYEATLNRYAIIPDGFKCCLGRRTALIRPDKQKIDYRFLFYYFFTPEWRAQIQANILTGATVDRIPLTTFPEFTIRVPSLDIQARIASILSAYDKFIAANQRRIQLLEESARLLYREWFVKLRFPGYKTVPVTDGVPEGWTICRLSEVADVNSSSLTSKDHPGAIRYVDISSVGTGEIGAVEEISFEEAPGRARRKVQHGDIIWSCVRPNRKSYALMWEPADNVIVSTGFAVLTARTVPFSYLYLASTTDDFVSYLTNQATGAAYPAVSGKDFEKASFLLPDAGTLADFDKHVLPLLGQIDAISCQNKQLSQARDMLLPKLMSGALDVSRIAVPKEVEA